MLPMTSGSAQKLKLGRAVFGADIAGYEVEYGKGDARIAPQRFPQVSAISNLADAPLLIYPTTKSQRNANE